MAEPKYDVALSFAGEEREVAERLASALKDRGIKVFYDDFEKAEIWGKDLYEFLSDVYLKQARLCVMFISEAYASKVWTNHERKSAQARALEGVGEYILPIRVDDSEIPGLLPTVAYLPYDDYSVEEIADLVKAKLSGGDKSVQGSEIKPGADYYASLGASIPAAETVARFGNNNIAFYAESGKVAEFRGYGDSQEIWLIADGREIGVNVPNSMVRVRKGHFMSFMTVAPHQPYPEFLVASLNYTTRRLVLADDEIRFLAAASIVGAEKAGEALEKVGKPAFGRAFGIAFLALFLSVFLTESRALQYVAFFVVFIALSLEPYIQKAGIKARTQALANFICTQYGYDKPVEL